jgi:hypothetical protein
LVLVMHMDLSSWGREEGAVLSSRDHKLSFLYRVFLVLDQKLLWTL